MPCNKLIIKVIYKAVYITKLWYKSPHSYNCLILSAYTEFLLPTTNMSAYLIKGTTMYNLSQ